MTTSGSLDAGAEATVVGAGVGGAMLTVFVVPHAASPIAAAISNALRAVMVRNLR